MQRNIYLKTPPIAEALETVKAAVDRERFATVITRGAHECAGYVAAEAVFAAYSSPTFHSAAMDGIAVKAAATYAAREDRPVELKLDKDFVYINTGNPLPVGEAAAGMEAEPDAVIMIENVTRVDDSTVSIESSAFPWQHVRRIGEDIVAAELLFPRHHLFTPYDVGSLLTAGVWEVKVFKPLDMVIMPTGDEVLDFSTRPKPGPGQVVESNSQLLAALAGQTPGVGKVTRVPPVPDEPGALREALELAMDGEAEIVVICAGSSAGSKDYTRSILDDLGEVLAHGVAAMPGKPTIVAKVRGKLVIGAPGFPVSAVVAFEEVAAPLIAWLGRRPHEKRRTIPVQLTRKTPSKLGRVEFIRLAVGKVGDRYVGGPLGRGAGNIGAMSRAQALVRVPAHSEGIEENATVEAELLVTRDVLDHNLIVVGSHDNTLDLLADELMAREPAIYTASNHVGSMGGLMAIKNGATHFAGAHLFDPETGDYNFPFLQKYLPGVDVKVVNLAIRHQGLIVAPGNPKGIGDVADLARGDVRYVNRQRGAGTRILLDYHLKQAGVDPHEVNGYGKEEYTHMAVAVNVLTGAADCGLGIMAAARALELDFVPLARERYDLIIPAEQIDDPRVLAVLDLLTNERVKHAIEAAGGYETSLTGQVMTAGLGLG